MNHKDDRRKGGGEQMLYTTLKLLKQNGACEDGLLMLKASLPKDHNVNDPISLEHILESNGLNHALWALRATTVNCDRQKQFMAIEFAESTLHIFEEKYPEDKRPRFALMAAKKFLQGEITAEEMSSAGAAADDAEWAAADDAGWDAAAAAAKAAAGVERNAVILAAYWAGWDAAAAAAKAAAGVARNDVILAAYWAARSAEVASHQLEGMDEQKKQRKIFLKGINGSQHPYQQSQMVINTNES